MFSSGGKEGLPSLKAVADRMIMRTNLNEYIQVIQLKQVKVKRMFFFYIQEGIR